MNVFDLISLVRANINAKATDLECVAMLREGERAVVNAIGGPDNPRMRPYLRGVTTGYLTAQNLALTLAGNAGAIVRGGITVDGQPGDELPAEYERACTTNPLYSRACVRIGNTLTFPGLAVEFTRQRGKTSALVRIVHERDYQSVVYIDGLLGYITSETVGYSKEQMLVGRITYPVGRQWADGELSGAIMRVVRSQSTAEDYSVQTNYVNTTESGYGQRLSVFPNPTIVPIDYPTFVETKEAVTTTYPLTISLIVLPEQLRIAILEWIKWNKKGDLASQRSFEISIRPFVK